MRHGKSTAQGFEPFYLSQLQLTSYQPDIHHTTIKNTTLFPHAAQVCPPSPHGTASHAPRHTPSPSGDGGMWWWFGLRLKWGGTCSGGAAGPKVDHVERKHGPAGTFVSPCSQVARPASEQEQLAPRPRAQVKQAPLAWGPPPLPAGAALHAAAPPPPAGMDPLAPHPHLARAAPPSLPTEAVLHPAASPPLAGANFRTPRPLTLAAEVAHMAPPLLPHRIHRWALRWQC